MSNLIPTANAQTHTEQQSTTDKGLIEPKQYQVIVINDDFTTFDFVVYILTRFFSKPTLEAEKLTHQIHQTGRGIAGIFSKDEAETKVKMVVDCARENQYPLLCEVEPID